MAERVAGRRLSGADALEVIVAEASSEVPVTLVPADHRSSFGSSRCVRTREPWRRVSAST